MIFCLAVVQGGELNRGVLRQVLSGTLRHQLWFPFMEWQVMAIGSTVLGIYGMIQVKQVPTYTV